LVLLGGKKQTLVQFESFYVLPLDRLDYASYLIFSVLGSTAIFEITVKQKMDIEEIDQKVKQWKSEGKTIAFTNGVFDILHVGHVRYLTEAAKLADKLVVAVNSDASVKRLGKGEDRPIHPEAARLEVIKALKPVTEAFIFSDDTPINAIQRILPNVLIKGGDYDPEETRSSHKRYIVGSSEVKKEGGLVTTIQLVHGFSSTQALTKLNKSGS